jgi:flavin reductase (DIM6/NTAB) family NADH-FMN oxidoreductase RutF
MVKIKYGPKPFAFPMPAFLVGSNVTGKPNFMVVAWAGIVNSRPPMIAVSLQPARYTLQGIKENNTFSVNIPSQSLREATDYCGYYSGRDRDKIKECGFNIFYGKLETAPMIDQCPVNLECRVFKMEDLGSHILIIGEILETYVSDDCILDDKPDVEKIKPLIYAEGPIAHYRGIGEVLGPAYWIVPTLSGKGNEDNNTPWTS